MCAHCRGTQRLAHVPGPATAAVKFELGQKVEFTNPITRSGDWDKATSIDRRFWVKPTIYADDHPLAEYTRALLEPREGMVVGARTLANGRVISRHEEGRTFHPEEHFTAYLVAFDLRRKPVLVMPEDITILEEPDDR